MSSWSWTNDISQLIGMASSSSRGDPSLVVAALVLVADARPPLLLLVALEVALLLGPLVLAASIIEVTTTRISFKIS